MSQNFASLAPDEDSIEGKWIWANNRMSSDECEKRIDWLIKNELEFLARDWSGWEILYRDKRDRRLWELTFPKSELQGGGPKSLRNISKEEAVSKYLKYAQAD